MQPLAESEQPFRRKLFDTFSVGLFSYQFRRDALRFPYAILFVACQATKSRIVQGEFNNLHQTEMNRIM